MPISYVDSVALVGEVEAGVAESGSLTLGSDDQYLFALGAGMNAFGGYGAIDEFNYGGDAGTAIPAQDADTNYYFDNGTCRAGEVLPSPTGTTTIYIDGANVQFAVAGASYDGVEEVVAVDSVPGVNGDVNVLDAVIEFDDTEVGDWIVAQVVAVYFGLDGTAFTTPDADTNLRDQHIYFFMGTVAADKEVETAGTNSVTVRINGVSNGISYVIKGQHLRPSAGGPAPIDVTAEITEENDTVVSTVLNTITVTAALTEDADTGAGTATATVTATAAITEDADTLSATAENRITVTAGINEQSDTLASTVVSAIAATAAINEEADTLASTIALPVAVTAAITEEDDTLSATAEHEEYPAIEVTAAITEQDDTLASVVQNIVTVSSAVTEANDTLSSDASASIAVTAALTEGADTLTSVVTAAINVVAALQEQGDTLESTVVGPGTIVVTMAVTEEDDTLVATSVTHIDASVNVTEESDTVVAATLLSILATANITEQNDTVAAITALVIVCSAALVEEAETLAATVRQLGPELPVPVVVRGDIQSNVAFDLGLLAIRADGSMVVIL